MTSAPKRLATTALRFGLLAVLGGTGAVGSEHAVRELPGPEGGWKKARLDVGRAEVLLRIADPEAPRAAATLTWRAGALEVLTDGDDVDRAADVPVLLATVEGGEALTLVPSGEAPGHEADLVVEVVLDPLATVTLHGDRLEIEATGPWAMPVDIPEEDPETPPRRRPARDARPVDPPPLPPAPAKLEVGGERVRVRVEGWPGDLDVSAERAEIEGQDLGGDLSVRPGRGDVELSRVGGAVEVRRERSTVTLDDVHGLVRVDVEDGDAWLSDCARGISLNASGGQVLLREILQRAEVRVEEGMLQVAGLRGHLGGGLHWTESTIESVVGNVRLLTREGRLSARDVAGTFTLDTSNTELDLTNVNARLQVGAAGAPVRVSGARRGLHLDVEEAEVTVQDVRQVLEITQTRGTLEASAITGIPQLELTDVELDYRQGGRDPRSGTIHLRGGRSVLRVPRRTRLALYGDAHRVKTTLRVDVMEESPDDPRPSKGHLSLTVEGGDVEVLPVN